MGNAQVRLNFVYYSSCAVAPFSIVGSSLTLVSLWRSKRPFDTYSRLVTCIASYDIILSTAIALGPVPIPPETGVPSAKGNLRTCEAQGFTIYVGLASFAYCAMLMWYYVAVIRYGVKQEFMAKWIEPWMHLVASGFYLINAVIGLQWEIFNFGSIYCLVAAWPLGCEETDEVDCLRGEEHVSLFGLWLTTVPFMTFNCLILLALVAVAATVIRRYWKSRQFSFRSTSNAVIASDPSHLSQETRQVVIQCILYALLFSNVMVWSTMGTILYLRGVEYDALTDPLFAIDALTVVLFPSTGFFLFLIFLRPRYLRMRSHYSRWRSVREAIWNPDQKFDRNSPSNRRREENSNSGASSSRDRNLVNASPVEVEETVSVESRKEPGSEETLQNTDPSASAIVVDPQHRRVTAGSWSLRNTFVASLISSGGLCQRASGFSLTEKELDVVSQQLGYSPTNFVRVSSRNKMGVPIAIQTYPLYGGAPRRQDKSRRSVADASLWLGTPFPTLYWLTCPDISRCIGELEREGYVKQFEQELQDNNALARQLQLAHEDYARERWQSLDKDDREQLMALSEESSTLARMRGMLESSGIAGITKNRTAEGALPPVKCLHTHYAHFRSQAETAPVNPIGARVHEILSDVYPDLIL